MSLKKSMSKNKKINKIKVKMSKLKKKTLKISK